MPGVPKFFHSELIWDGDALRRMPAVVQMSIDDSKANSRTFLKPHKRLQKIIVGVGYASQHPWDESLQAEDELETLKKRYQKNMALVSRQAKVPLLILFGLVGLVAAHLGHLCTVFARGGQELEDCQEEVDTWKEEAATKSQTIAEHLQAVVSGLMYLDVIIWCI